VLPFADLAGTIRAEGLGPLERPGETLRSRPGTGLADLDHELGGLDGLTRVAAPDVRLARALVFAALRHLLALGWVHRRSAVVLSPTLGRRAIVRALLAALARVDPRERFALTREQAFSWRGAVDVLQKGADQLRVHDGAAPPAEALVAQATALAGPEAPPLALVAVLDLEAVPGDRPQASLRELAWALDVPVIAVSRWGSGDAERDGSPGLADRVLRLEAAAPGVEARRGVTCSASTACGTQLARVPLVWTPATDRLEGAVWEGDRPPGDQPHVPAE